MHLTGVFSPGEVFSRGYLLLSWGFVWVGLWVGLCQVSYLVGWVGLGR